MRAPECICLAASLSSWSSNRLQSMQLSLNLIITNCNLIMWEGVKYERYVVYVV